VPLCHKQIGALAWLSSENLFYFLIYTKEDVRIRYTAASRSFHHLHATAGAILQSLERVKCNVATGSACCLLHAGFLLGLFFDHEDGGDTFLQNLG
jgi:hypothetical protein